jgi:hypothetical protein
VCISEQPAGLGAWRLNHIHSTNGAEVINASCSDSSAEIGPDIPCSQVYLGSIIKMQAKRN